MSVLSKWDDIVDLFVIDEFVGCDGERYEILISLHKIHGLIFRDDMGYCINKYLIMDGI